MYTNQAVHDQPSPQSVHDVYEHSELSSHSSSSRNNPRLIPSSNKFSLDSRESRADSSDFGSSDEKVKNYGAGDDKKEDKSDYSVMNKWISDIRMLIDSDGFNDQEFSF